MFSEFYAPLCLFANRYIQDHEISKDIVQDVFVKLWERDTPIANGVTVKSFLYVTVRNACLNYLRQKAVEEKRIEEYSNSNFESLFEQSMLEEEVHHKLYKAVNQLSPRAKESILLTIKGYSNKEIAEEMKISVNSVKTLKQRSYRALKGELLTIFD